MAPEVVLGVSGVEGLAREGLLDEIAREFSDQFAENTVIRTEPAADETIEKGSVVRVVVSDGPESAIVPSLASLDLSNPTAVENVLKDLGFVTQRIEREIPFGDPGDGQVIDLDPEPGTELILGSEVVVVIGKQAPPPTTTSTPPPPTTAAP